MCLGAPALGVVYSLAVRRYGDPPEILPWLLHSPRISNDFVVGLLFCAHLVGFAAIADRFQPALVRVARPIRWCAGATFTIYLFHLPIAQFLTTVLPWPPQALATRLMMLPGTLALLFAIAEVTERRKADWRGWIDAAIGAARLRPSAPT